MSWSGQRVGTGAPLPRPPTPACQWPHCELAESVRRLRARALCRQPAPVPVGRVSAVSLCARCRCRWGRPSRASVRRTCCRLFELCVPLAGLPARSPSSHWSPTSYSQARRTTNTTPTNREDDRNNAQGKECSRMLCWSIRAMVDSDWCSRSSLMERRGDPADRPACQLQLGFVWRSSVCLATAVLRCSISIAW